MKTKTLTIISVLLALFLALSISLATVSSSYLIAVRNGRLYFTNFAETITPGKAFTLTVLNADDVELELAPKYTPDNFRYTVHGKTDKGYRFGLNDDVDFARAFEIENDGATLTVTCKYYDVFLMLADLYNTVNITFVGESDVAFDLTLTSGKRTLNVELTCDMLFTGEQGIYDGNFDVELDKEGILFGL